MSRSQRASGVPKYPKLFPVFFNASNHLSGKGLEMSRDFHKTSRSSCSSLFTPPFPPSLLASMLASSPASTQPDLNTVASSPALWAPPNPSSWVQGAPDPLGLCQIKRDKRPERMPDRMPDSMSENMLDKMSDRMPDRTAECTSDRMAVYI